MQKEMKKNLIKQYVVALVLLALTIVVLIGMYGRAKKDDAAAVQPDTQTESQMQNHLEQDELTGDPVKPGAR